MGQDIDYAAVLADLEAKRASIDAAVNAVKAILGQAHTPDAPGLSTERVSQRELGSEVVPGVFHGMSVSEAARKFLEMTKKKQKTRDVCDALQRGGIETSSKNFYGNVFTTMMRTKDFIKLGKYWALAEWHPTRIPPALKPKRTKKRAPKKSSAPPASPEEKG